MTSSPPVRVLLVEDDDAYAALIGRELAVTSAPVSLERTPSLGAALDRLLSGGAPDAILLDLALPDSDGLASLRSVLAVAANAPIIVLTARDDDRSAQLAMQHGAQDYLLKGETDGRSLWRAIRYARERAALRAELVAREARFRALVEYSTDAVTLVTADFVALYNSRGVERNTGYSAEELQGQRLDAFAHPEDLPAIRARFEECLAQPGRALTIEFRYRHKDGTWRFGEGTIVNHIADPAIAAIVVNHRDITDRKDAERMLRDTEERLRQSMKMEAVGRLAGGVAHDFNNVLTAIFGYSDLLRDQLPEGDQRRADLEEIRRSAERAASLTRQLLAFSRKQVMQPRILNVNDVVGNIHKLLTKLLGDEIALEFRREGDLWPVKADPGQLEQVLMNLAANARDAMPDGGRLLIGSSNASVDAGDEPQRPGLKPGDYVLLTVTDTGAGIPESIRRNIFEPFFTTKDQGKGTGLGLATVYGIVKQTGGGIYVESEEGKGTRFDIFLPRVPLAAATSSA